MAAYDPDNYIKLFRLEDNNQDSLTSPEYMEIIPAEKGILQTMFNSEYQLPQQSTCDYVFSKESINLLIKFRIELEELFEDCGDILGIAAVLWEDISRRLLERGFMVSAKQAAEKWDELYSEYIKIANSDNEQRISAWEYFAAFESSYNIRSKYIDSKILEDITEYLSSRSHSPSSATKNEEIIGTDGTTESSDNKENFLLSREDFSTLSNEDDSQMLIEAINAAQNILEENLEESDNETSLGIKQKRDSKATEKSGGISRLEKHTKIDNISSSKKVAEISRNRVKDDSAGDQIFMRSAETNFYWDFDATQCFLDLRLYVEMSRDTKLSILRKYKTIVAFISQKMLMNGYKVSEIDCRRKWAQLLRNYNKELKILKEGDNAGQIKSHKVQKSSQQIDKVLKKSGLAENGDDTEKFYWNEQSMRKLIEIRIPMENAFAMFKRYIILWQYVASQMKKYNFTPTYNECSIKWMELREIYDFCYDYIKKGAPRQDIKWTFYEDMRKGFEQNSKSPEAIINHKCSTEPEVNVENQSYASPASPSFNDSKIDDSNEENKRERTNASQATLNRAIIYYNLSENIIGGTNLNSTDNVPDVSQKIDSEMKTSKGNSSVKSRKRETLRIEEIWKDIKIPSCTTIERVDYRRETPAGKNTEKITTCNSSAILKQNDYNVGWTDEATILMIKFKVSRELSFRNPSCSETDLWKEIARDMQSAGHDVSHESCAVRWYRLIAVYKNSPSPESAQIIRPEFKEQFKLTELPLTKNTEQREDSKAGDHIDIMDFEETKSIWTDDAVKKLFELKFSKEIRPLQKYSTLVAEQMQAAGYPTITPSAVAKKWAGLSLSYKKSLFRLQIGQDVKWQYFKLMDSYVKGFNSVEETKSQKKGLPFLWTQNAVQKLIDLKLLLEKSSPTRDRQTLVTLWKEVADGMMTAGFKVTNHECAMEWRFLMKAYVKTRKELRKGNGAVIGKYFIMMDKALSNELNNKNGNIREEPIDFSMTRRKRKLGENKPGIDQAKSPRLDVPEIEKQSGNLPLGNRNELNLSKDVSLTPKNCSTVVDLSNNKIEILPEDNICVNQDGVSPREQGGEPSPILELLPDKIQQEANDSICEDIPKENYDCNDNKMLCVKRRINFKEDTCLKTLSINHNLEFKHPLLNLRVLAQRGSSLIIKEGEIYSGKNIGGAETGERWNETGTHLLINLQLQHNRKNPGFPRPEIEWDETAGEMAMLGYNYTSVECRDKWYSLKEIFEKNISEIRGNRGAQASWPYFEGLHTMYNMFRSFYNGLKLVLPRKRSRDDGDEEKQESVSPKRLTLSLIPDAQKGSVITQSLIICDIENLAKDQE